MTTVSAPLAVVVLTKNEEANLDRCLASVSGWVREVFVVDSGSTDGTVAIARHHGATVVTRAFDGHAKQWRWAFDHLPLRSPWVLAIDADQRVSRELRTAMIEALTRPEAAGYFLKRRQMFRGRWIRHGGYYPKLLLKLCLRSGITVRDGDLVDHHFEVNGHLETLDGDLIEENKNEDRIANWIEKHNRYAQLQAQEELARLAGGGPRGRLFGNSAERVDWSKALWLRLPLYWRPFLYFSYRYVLRLGFLDGKEGLIFHFLQALWYRFLVDINRDELAARPPGGGARGQ